MGVVEHLAVMTPTPRQCQRNKLRVVDMQHLRLESLQVAPCLPLTDDKSANPTFLAV